MLVCAKHSVYKYRLVLTQPMSVAIALKPFIRHGDHNQAFVRLMSQCEGMHNAVKAGNVAALERKSPAVLRK